MRGVSVAVVMTCHNRAAMTLRAIDAIKRAGARAAARLSIFLTDDGSTDGTADLVRRRFPEVRIVAGDGSLYWNRGMLAAWRAAREVSPDFYLWLNDDLEVGEDALADALACFGTDTLARRIVVGKTIDPRTGAVTYGAYARAEGVSRLRFRRLRDGETGGVTMNGNFVVIPARAAEELGMNDPVFTHASGDVDYGLRASRRGYAIVECPRAVGFQERNDAYAERTSRMTLREARGVMTHPKGVPWREWLHFTRTHGGALWPVNFVYRYLKMLVLGVRHRSARG